MKIIYKQTENEQGLDIRKCYFKELRLDRDSRVITKKTHHHTCFEMHIIAEGSQEYKVDGKIYSVKSGEFILIAPGTSHLACTFQPDTKKYSVTFESDAVMNSACCFGKMSERMSDDLSFILTEADRKREISPILIKNSIFELVVLAFRLSGMKESGQAEPQGENALVSLAKQYIEDNLESFPDVSEVAQYCYISTKQLTRLFRRYEEISPGEYIIKLRTRKIEALIAQPSLSLKQISEKMNFCSEYYFSAFCKKHLGMPPGAYRKMLGK